MDSFSQLLRSNPGSLGARSAHNVRHFIEGGQNKKRAAMPPRTNSGYDQTPQQKKGEV